MSKLKPQVMCETSMEVLKTFNNWAQGDEKGLTCYRRKGEWVNVPWRRRSTDNQPPYVRVRTFVPVCALSIRKILGLVNAMTYNCLSPRWRHSKLSCTILSKSASSPLNICVQMNIKSALRREIEIEDNLHAKQYNV